MGIFQIALILATFLSSLVAGFLFAFAVVAMPGMRNLNDREFIQTFQVMDRIIQDNQPLFMVVWVGSIIVLIISAVLGIWQLSGIHLWLLILATLIYTLGVQLPTMRINIPMNNKLQTLDVDVMDRAGHKVAREAFEPRWNQWNVIRTALASLTSALLIVLLFML